MVQMKIFASDDWEVLEKQVNDWFKEHDHFIQIVSFDVSESWREGYTYPNRTVYVRYIAPANTPYRE